MTSTDFYAKLTSINFTVKNISPQRKKITIFNYPLEFGQSRDLFTIPEISEDNIRSSLVKGELANKIRAGDIKIVSSSINLLQFDAQQLAFIEAALQSPSATPGVDPGVIGGGGGVTDVTYNELTALIFSNGLVPGSCYKITDFRTCYDQPMHDVNGNAVAGIYKQADIDPIIVKATSSNTLAPDAYQPSYPNDKIKYDWTWGQTENTLGEAFGRITERIDEYNNRTDYDHRTILFKRWRTYYYNTGNPLTGLVTISGGTYINGNGTLFTNLNVGNVINIEGFNYIITQIYDDLNMQVEGVEYQNYSNVRFYLAEPETDGDNSNIPYTHTQMTDPPVDYQSEASVSDFIMDGAVQSGENYFGAGSQYFTNLYPGMFTLVAKNINVNYFAIDGNIGADGSGSVDTYVYNTNVNGNNYTAYVKRVFGAGDPSINHIMIVNTDGTGIYQDYDSFTNDDYHKISNLSSVTEIHFLILSRYSPDDKIEDSAIDLIVDTYLGLVEGLSISATLTALNSSYPDITTLVPNLYLFNDVDEGTPSNIDDGGDDMYDGANFIYTDLTQKWKCYEWKQSNIVNDISREFTTFRTEDEFEINGEVTSVSNYIGDYATYYLNAALSIGNFLLPNITFGLYSYGNKLGDCCYNIGTYNWFSRNQISGTFQKNTLRKGFYSNVIGEYFRNNEIFAYCWRNKIGEGFEDNFLGTNNFENNVINNGFNENILCMGDNFYKNFIKNGFNNNEIYSEFRGNEIGNDYNQNNIYSQFEDNSILDYFNNNTIGDSTLWGNYNFYKNQIGFNFENNITNGSFHDNEIKNSFTYNNVGDNFIKNQIGNNFSDNTIGINFGYNVIIDEFISNSIGNDFGYGGSAARGNRIGSAFQSNTVGEYFYDNVVCDQVSSNTIVNDFRYNNITSPFNSTDLSSATHVYGNYNCTIFKRSDGTVKLSYYDGTDTLVVVALNA